MSSGALISLSYVVPSVSSFVDEMPPHCNSLQVSLPAGSGFLAVDIKSKSQRVFLIFPLSHCLYAIDIFLGPRV